MWIADDAIVEWDWQNGVPLAGEMQKCGFWCCENGN
jgi:hypothetical protein